MQHTVILGNVSLCQLLVTAKLKWFLRIFGELLPNTFVDFEQL